MSQVASAKTLDLKTVKPNLSSKKKAKDDGFRKELDEKEKKTSDRDHLSAAHQNSVEKRDPARTGAEDSKNALRSKANETKAKNINEKGPQEASTSAAAAKTDGEAKMEVAGEPVKVASPVVAPSAEQTQQVTAEAVAASSEAQTAELEALTAMAAGQKIAKEGLSLEGMTLVNPQMMQAPTAAATGAESAEAPAATLTQEISAAMSALTGQDGKSADTDKGGSEGQLNDLKSEQLNEALNSALQAHGKQREAHFETALKAAAGAPITEGTREANVDNLVQSARTLLRNGGGEMQIILNPEGLGAIDLKVNVQGNEVNIEVIAQDQNVKKMFEDGVQDIRGALELQNLKIDTFKVDVGQRSESNHFADQQAQQENANREFARDFMNQFRGERQGMRQQSLGYDMERSPSFGKSPEGLSPAQKVGANGRLNIVA